MEKEEEEEEESRLEHHPKGLPEDWFTTAHFK